MLLAMQICDVNSCESKLYANGVCRRHYDMKRRTGGEITEFQQERHGLSGHPIYDVWIHMKNRIAGYHASDAEAYAGRGIGICQEWLDSFQTFYDWALPLWKPGLELDRIDNDKGYSPDNCRFVPHAENMRNTRRKQELTASGETKVLAEWAEDYRCAVDRVTLYNRTKRGWDAEEAITKPSSKHPEGPRRKKEQ